MYFAQYFGYERWTIIMITLLDKINNLFSDSLRKGSIADFSAPLRGDTRCTFSAIFG